MKHKVKRPLWKKYLYKTDFLTPDGQVDYFQIESFIKDVIKTRDMEWEERIVIVTEYLAEDSVSFFCDDAIQRKKLLKELKIDL